MPPGVCCVCVHVCVRANDRVEVSVPPSLSELATGAETKVRKGGGRAQPQAEGPDRLRADTGPEAEAKSHQEKKELSRQRPSRCVSALSWTRAC